MKKTAMFALLAASALLLQGQEKGAKMSDKAASVKYTEPGYFTVDLPAGWTKTSAPFGLSDREKKVHGATFSGPPGPDKLPAQLSVHYYAPGNRLHKTPELFIKRHAQPVLGANPDGDVYGKLKDEEVGGRKAKTFERFVTEYYPPRSVDPKKIAMYEHFAVLTMRSGFFVLKYRAQKETAKEHINAFKDAVYSFVPLVK